MSQENVDIVRRSIDAYNRRDIDGISAVNHQDVVLDWSASRGWVAGVYRGGEVVMGFFEEYFEAFQEIVVEPSAYIDAGTSVVVPNVSRSRGRDGIEVLARSTFVFTLRDRKIIRIHLYQETDDALQAVGLGGESGSWQGS
jgi:ketosteroid isomerase-like protein